MNRKSFSILPQFFYMADGVAGAGSAGAQTPGETPKTPEPKSETPKAQTGETPNTPTNQETPEPKPLSPNMTPTELRNNLQTAEKRIGELNTENAGLRHKAKVADDDRAELAEWRKLGIKPSDALAKIEAGAKLEGKIEADKKANHAKTLAEKAGFDGDAFLTLEGAATAAEYVEGKSEKDGKQIETIIAKYTDEQGKEQEKSFAEFVALKWPTMVERIKKIPTRTGVGHLRQRSGSDNAQTGAEPVKSEVRRRHNYKM